MLTHIQMVMYTLWCWHIYKGEVVGVEVDQLEEENEVPWVDRILATGGPDPEWVSPVINPSQSMALWSFGPKGGNSDSMSLVGPQ